MLCPRAEGARSCRTGLPAVQPLTKHIMAVYVVRRDELESCTLT
jgi:hypothetical protein